MEAAGCTLLTPQVVLSGWEIKLDLPGRLRLKNPVLYRKSELCQAIERELMGVLGIDQFKTNSLTCTVLVHYDPQQLSQDQVIEILDSALADAEHPTRARQARPAPADLHGLAAAGGGGPVRGPAAAAGGRGGVRLHVDPDASRRRGSVLVEEKRLGVDVLDAIVMVGCLGTMAIFPGAVLLLVPQLRPRPGQADAGQLQEAAAERLRQAAAVRLALPRRRPRSRSRSTSSRRATSSSSTPARSCRSTGTSSRAWR